MHLFDFGIKDLPNYLELVHGRLKELAPGSMDGLTRMLETGGKRLRPALLIAIVQYYGKTVDDRVIDAAAAAELVHIASLVHDDIMDKGDERWGQPTIYAKEGVNAAILAGDYLLAKGFALACSVDAEAGTVIAETIADLCEGQAHELRDQFNLDRTPESLVEAIKGKTASLFMASCALGGIVAGLDDRERSALSRFAENFGIAFQYMDDVNDFVASAEIAGKSVGNDIREGTYTLPVILSLQGPHGTKLKKLLLKKAPISQILAILKKDDSLGRTIKAAEAYKQKALVELKNLRNPELAVALGAFTEHI